VRREIVVLFEDGMGTLHVTSLMEPGDGKHVTSPRR